MRIRLWHLIIFFTISSFPVYAQYYSVGQDPAKAKWLEIETDRFKVIFPESYRANAIEFLNELEDAESSLELSFGEVKSSKKMPIVIHSYSFQSNGTVVWAPRRMEIFPTPQLDMIPQDFKQQLAIHELTHVRQMESLNNKFLKSLGFLFGEQIVAVPSFFLPQWYLEGHAVFMESFYSQSGRGRSAAFQKQLKAIAVERGSMYKYDKLLNGSYKDFVPNNYYTGYQVMAHSIKEYGGEIWNHALKRTADAFLLLNPVNQSLKKDIGMGKAQLFQTSFDSLGARWKREDISNRYVDYKSINEIVTKGYTNFYSPILIDSTTVASIQTSFQKTPRIVLIDTRDSKEDVIHYLGDMNSYNLSYSAPFLVWVENKKDPRWGQRGYSVIKILDINTHKTKVIGSKSRYLYAAISPDGKTIATTVNSAENANSLLLIDVNSDEVLASIDAPDNIFLQRPSWSDDMSEIVFIGLSNAGEGIVSYRIQEGRWETLIEPNVTDYQSVRKNDDALFFVSSASGTENCYMMTADSMVKQLTNSRYGATDLFISDGGLFFSDYSLTGNNICYSPLNEVDAGVTTGETYYTIQHIPPAESPVEDKAISSDYSVKRFKKSSNMMNIHSWMPFYTDINSISVEPTEVSWGALAMSQNLLNTFVTTLGYEYDGFHKLHGSAKWAGWYPIFEMKLDYGGENDFLNYSPYHNYREVNLPRELLIDGNIYVPLSFSSGRFHQLVYPSITFSYNNHYSYYEEANQRKHQLGVMTRLYLANTATYSTRDIYPSFGQVVDYSFYFYPFDKTLNSALMTFKSAFYFPGFLPNNGIKIKIEFERQRLNSLIFMNRSSHPRGYGNVFAKQVNFYSIDYVLPLFYPDINVGSLLYVTRLRGGVFYDYAHLDGGYMITGTEGFTGNDSVVISSTGFEIMSDIYCFRIPYEISIGVRSSWIKERQGPVVELLLSMNVFGHTIGSFAHGN